MATGRVREMVNESQLLQVIAAIHDAAGEPQQWPACLSKIGELLRGHIVGLFAHDLQSSLATSRLWSGTILSCNGNTTTTTRHAMCGWLEDGICFDPGVYARAR